MQIRDYLPGSFLLLLLVIHNLYIRPCQAEEKSQSYEAYLVAPVNITKITHFLDHPRKHYCSEGSITISVDRKPHTIELLAQRHRCHKHTYNKPTDSSQALLTDGTLIDFFRAPYSSMIWKQVETHQPKLSKKIYWNDHQCQLTCREFKPCYPSFKSPHSLPALMITKRLKEVALRTGERPAMHSLLSTVNNPHLQTTFFLSWYPEFIQAMTETRYRYILCNISNKNTNLRIENSRTYKNHIVTLLTVDDFQPKLKEALHLYSMAQPQKTFWDLLIVEDHKAALILIAKNQDALDSEDNAYQEEIQRKISEAMNEST